MFCSFQCLSLSVYTSSVKFIPKYFIFFDSTVNGIVFIISFSCPLVGQAVSLRHFCEPWAATLVPRGHSELQVLQVPLVPASPGSGPGADCPYPLQTHIPTGPGPHPKSLIFSFASCDSDSQHPNPPQQGLDFF